jgi:hypothetical protein
MASFPFADLLDTLRLKGVAVGVADYQAAARLIARWDGATAGDVRLAIAALLATNAEQHALVLETFDEIYVHEPSPPPPPPRSPNWFERFVAALRPWHLGVLVIAGLLVFAAARLFPPQLPPSQTSSNASPPVTAPIEVPPIPEPALPPPPVIPNNAANSWLTALAALLSATLIWAARTRNAQYVSAIRAWQQALADLGGPSYYTALADVAPARQMRHALSDAATLLGRRFAETIESDELDVDLTLAETLRGGLRPALVFKTPPLPSPIVILRDIGPEMRAWVDKIDAFVNQLAKSGVVIEPWYFDEDAAFVSRTTHGRPVTLSSLANRHDGSALLVISTGAGVPSALADRRSGWIRILAEWPDRVWLTPISHPLYWRAELRRQDALPLRVCPMTRQGVITAARVLTSGDISTARQRASDVRSITPDDVERVKRLVAMVPYPTIKLVEQLRQRFLPDVPEDVVLFLSERGRGRSSGMVRLDESEIRRLAAAMRRDAPARELEIRGFLKDILDRSRPEPGSAAYLRWELDTAIHDLHLAALAPQDHTPPTQTLQRLADGPLGEEVRTALGIAAAASQGRAARAVRKLESRPVAPPPLSLDRIVSTRWPWPRVGELLAAGVGAAVVAAVLAQWHPFGGREVPHELNAYVLVWVPGDQGSGGALLAYKSANVAATIPNVADVYRKDEKGEGNVGSVKFDPGVSTIAFPVSRDMTGAQYQLRAALDEGNLAVSDSLYVPAQREVIAPPPPPGTPVPVIVDIRPWARVRIRRSDGTYVNITGDDPSEQAPVYTPFSVMLLPGDYKFECDTEGLTRTQTFDVSVKLATAPQVVSLTMPGFDPDRVVDDLIRQPALRK